MENFVLGIISKIWQKVETVIIEHAGDNLAGYLAGRLVRFESRYKQTLAHQAGKADVQGLKTKGPFTLELAQVYVRLKVVPFSPGEANNNPIHNTKIKPDLLQGEHEIWEFIRDPQLRSIVILGPPGAGKTTLMKHIVLTMVDDDALRKTHIPAKLPILLYLRDHAEVIHKQPNITLGEIVVQALGLDEVPHRWFERRLEKGDFLIIFDGLDELAHKEAGQSVTQWIQKQVTQHHQCKVVITSRPGGYRDHYIEVDGVVHVQPFTRDQQREFVLHWYRAVEIRAQGKNNNLVRKDAAAGAEDLLKRIYNTAAIMRMASNPLLLTMIANVHKFSSRTLPENRAGLYDEICQSLMGRRQQEKGILTDADGLRTDQKIRVLEKLAYDMMQVEERALKLDDIERIIAPELELVGYKGDVFSFMQLMQDSSGLVLEREQGEYEFAHLTFQEYLASQYILHHGEILETELQAKVGITWWHEVIRLYCARSDASQIIQACLDQRPLDVATVRLALDCQAEAQATSAEVDAKLEDITNIWIDDVESEKRRVAGAARLARRVRELPENTVDGIEITIAEFEAFLSPRNARYRPMHWSTDSLNGRQPVTGVEYEAAQVFCNWLTEREGTIWFYSLPDQKMELTNNSKIGFWLENGDFQMTSTVSRLSDAIIHRYSQNDGLDISASNQLFFSFTQVLTSVSDFASARDLVSTFALASALDFDLDTAFARDFVLSVILGRASDTEITRIYEITRFFFSENDGAAAILTAPRPELAYNLTKLTISNANLSHALVLSIALTLVKSIVRAFDRVTTLSIHTTTHTLELSRNLTSALDINSSIDLDYILANALELKEAVEECLALSYTAGEQDITGIMALVIVLHGFILGWLEKDKKLFFPTVRKQVADVIRILSRGDGPKPMNDLLVVYKDLWVQLVMLEERRAGRLAAFEGIRIVKKRIPESELKL